MLRKGIHEEGQQLKDGVVGGQTDQDVHKACLGLWKSYHIMIMNVVIKTFRSISRLARTVMETMLPEVV